MAKILKATHGSDKTPLVLGEVEIPAYVLENGQRVFSGRGIQKALGYQGSSGDWLTNFIKRDYISTHIKAGVLKAFDDRVKFKRVDSGGSQPVTYGYEATVLIDLCDAILSAKKAGDLGAKQAHLADQAEAIIRAVAKVGIVALVDEVTGYQYDRERDALQKILKAYISEELLPWQKRFPDEYYKEIFRLNGWNFTIGDIKKRPGVIGHWTNNLIYKKLPKGVLENLKENTPKSKDGNYTARFHQSLSMDIGEPHLEKQLVSVITIMKISDNWEDFIFNFQKAYGQQELFDKRSFKKPKDDK